MVSSLPSGESALMLTGERTLPGIPEENYWFARHVAGYDFAAAVLSERGRHRRGPVLDSGCGEGYGTSRLCTDGRLVVGLDRFADAVTHAHTRYPQAAFVRAEAVAVPAADASFGAVVSLQVIEHLPDPDAYLAECRRILRPGGRLVLGTPNRLTFTPPGRPKNPFHIVEFSPSELAGLARRHFSEVNVHGLYDDHPGLADALIDSAFAAEDPPAWAREAVPRVEVSDFRVDSVAPDCLDLLAACRT